MKMRQKGSDSINKASKARGSNIATQVGQSVHIHCRKAFIDPKRILCDQKREKVQDSPSSCTLRSETPEFEYKEHCLFCGQVAKYVNKKRGNDVFPVRTSDFQNGHLLELKGMNGYLLELKGMNGHLLELKEMNGHLLELKG